MTELQNDQIDFVMGGTMTGEVTVNGNGDIQGSVRSDDLIGDVGRIASAVGGAIGSAAGAVGSAIGSAVGAIGSVFGF